MNDEPKKKISMKIKQISSNLSNLKFGMETPKEYLDNPKRAEEIDAYNGVQDKESDGAIKVPDYLAYKPLPYLNELKSYVHEVKMISLKENKSELKSHEEQKKIQVSAANTHIFETQTPEPKSHIEFVDQKTKVKLFQKDLASKSNTKHLTKPTFNYHLKKEQLDQQIKNEQELKELAEPEALSDKSKALKVVLINDQHTKKLKEPQLKQIPNLTELVNSEKLKGTINKANNSFFEDKDNDSCVTFKEPNIKMKIPSYSEPVYHSTDNQSYQFENEVLICENKLVTGELKEMEKLKEELPTKEQSFQISQKVKKFEQNDYSQTFQQTEMGQKIMDFQILKFGSANDDMVKKDFAKPNTEENKQFNSASCEGFKILAEKKEIGLIKKDAFDQKY